MEGEDVRLVNPMEMAATTSKVGQQYEPFEEVGLEESLGLTDGTPSTELVNISIAPELLQKLLGLQQPGVQSATLEYPQVPIQCIP